MAKGRRRLGAASGIEPAAALEGFIPTKYSQVKKFKDLKSSLLGSVLTLLPWGSTLKVTLAVQELKVWVQGKVVLKPTGPKQTVQKPWPRKFQQVRQLDPQGLTSWTGT